MRHIRWLALMESTDAALASDDGILRKVERCKAESLLRTNSQSRLPERSAYAQVFRIFQTLHDERAPTGNLGRGTHYSILRAVAFSDPTGNPLNQGHFADFAVIWDEDHDERIMTAIERVYFAGFLSRFLMFGERKGTFTAIAASPSGFALQPVLEEFTRNVGDDYWDAKIVEFDKPSDRPIIDAPDESVTLYLRNLLMLWELGVKLPSHGKKLIPGAVLAS